MERIRIEYPTGYMEFVCDAYFPFTLKKAKQVFKLINEYCSEEVKRELKAYLTERAKGYKAECKLYADKAADYPPKSKECRGYTGKFNKANMLYKRMKKNIEMLNTEEL